MNCQLFIVGVAVGASVLYAAIRIGRAFGHRQKDPCAGAAAANRNNVLLKYVMTHAYSNAIIDKVEEALKNGIVGNEDDDW